MTPADRRRDEPQEESLARSSWRQAPAAGRRSPQRERREIARRRPRQRGHSRGGGRGRGGDAVRRPAVSDAIESSDYPQLTVSVETDDTRHVPNVAGASLGMQPGSWPSGCTLGRERPRHRPWPSARAGRKTAWSNSSWRPRVGARNIMSSSPGLFIPSPMGGTRRPQGAIQEALSRSPGRARLRTDYVDIYMLRRGRRLGRRRNCRGRGAEPDRAGGQTRPELRCPGARGRSGSLPRRVRG